MGSLAELYGAILQQNQDPQGILSAARFNPLMLAKALQQRQMLRQQMMQNPNPYGGGSLDQVRNSPTPAAAPWDGMQGRGFFGVRG